MITTLTRTVTRSVTQPGQIEAEGSREIVSQPFLVPTQQLTTLGLVALSVLVSLLIVREVVLAYVVGDDDPALGRARRGMVGLPTFAAILEGPIVSLLVLFVLIVVERVRALFLAP